VPGGCWHCGAPWRCPVCGSFRQRPGRTDCADCHRRREQERQEAQNERRRKARDARRREEERLDRDYFPLTPAMRAYLRAFDTYLQTTRSTGTDEAAQWAAGRRERAFEEMAADQRKRMLSGAQ
jgi:hypothetical protein